MTYIFTRMGWRAIISACMPSYDGPCGMTRSHVHPTTINDDLTSNEVQDCLGGMPLHAEIND